MPKDRIASAVFAFQTELVKACRAAKRDPAEVIIVAVTKTRSTTEVNAVLAAGIRVIGENRVQEALTKFSAVGSCERHLIGHLQTNKAAEAVQYFDCVESVDSIRLAEKLASEAGKIGKTLEIYLQANLAGETTKSGFAESELSAAVAIIKKLPNLKLTGLMVIGPHTDEEAVIRQVFMRGDQLRKELGLSNYSAGMSSDWQLAVACGATHLRPGSAIFGGRN